MAIFPQSSACRPGCFLCFGCSATEEPPSTNTPSSLNSIIHSRPRYLDTWLALDYPKPQTPYPPSTHNSNS